MIFLLTSAFTRGFSRRVERIVYARHGHELMGCKSPVGEPTLVGIECDHLAPSEQVHPFDNPIERQLLAEGKGATVR